MPNNKYDPNYVFQDDPDPALLANLERAAVNRANAQNSTGPTTQAGKLAASRNSLKHGLTGNTVLLDSDDAAAYQKRLDEAVEQYRPVTFEERRLVQSIHDSAWRLDRILDLESTIYAKGRIDLTEYFAHIPEEQRKSFVQLETTQRFARDLRNLHIQEARLQRQRAKDLVSLEKLIQQRLASERLASEKDQPKTAQPESGFVFENSKNPAFPSSENQLQAELNLAGGGGSVGDQASGRTDLRT